MLVLNCRQVKINDSLANAYI